MLDGDVWRNLNGFRSFAVFDDTSPSPQQSR
ncbi:hypothetical protein B0G80_1667 [Paraburkholderia sp. BL6669N2]|nr:hypothetical protein B0G80_1667 [Paraburkholderia sp. BL6669N2]